MINPYMKEAEEIRKAIDVFAKNQTDETLLDNKVAFSLWRAGVQVVRKQILRFNDDLYRVNQDHTTQDDWTPDITPALFTKISLEEYPQWRQPTGAHDAYKKGAKVSDEGKRWISNKDVNIYKPGLVPGDWSEVE
ncbi:MAG: hypothetical protein II679_03345 [Ruminococcus sp.]|nr:hypothetical protein [Ruminococcus sp.]